MPNIASMRMPSYTDDFGNTYLNVPFKIKDEYKDSISLGYQENNTAICSSTAGIFNPRAVIATFLFSGIVQKIRFPVPSPEQIPTAVNQLIAAAECIELDGESWTLLPPTRFNYNSFFGSYTLPQDSSKETGTFGYSSDLLGAIRSKYAVELNPSNLSGPTLDCMDDRDTVAVCPTTIVGFRTRRLILTARNTNGGTIVRQAPVTGRSILASCVSSYTNIVACLGYKGESIRNLQALV